MIQRCHSAGLLLKTAQPRGILGKGSWEYLNRNYAVQTRIPSTVHFAHPARAQSRHDVIRTESFSRCQRHVGVQL